ncbi:MAG: hypothetical protein HGA59_05500 [Chlorobiaceae bacterium]|jgi:hypothetical protein|nr:hypothetical protein [Chlorobiaceae bacterium]NTV16602.1 hypothetical protein [Chlorobiaceae bacterium]
MQPIRINNYCFDRIHTWIQYDKRIPQFIEVVIEVFYPENRQADGLVMFSHGFLIGNDLLYYPKKIIGGLLNENPLFGINPSRFYNYSSAIVEHNWAMAFVTASHLQSVAMPWIDFGGNPRVGQDAYAAASYLVKYGATDEFYRIDEHNRNSSFYSRELVKKTGFMKSNNVIFAGHSVGGAHAQVASVGFSKLHEIGKRTCLRFDPVLYDREFLPALSSSMSSWSDEERANPVGFIQLSPVDMNVPILAPGMEPYRDVLSESAIPSVMVIGQCDNACLSMSQPPAWSSDSGKESQFRQLASEKSWATVASVEKGSHCGYLTEKNTLCSVADISNPCKSTIGKDTYKAGGDESLFTTELLRNFINLYYEYENGGANGGFNGDFNQWRDSKFMKWLNRKSPDGRINLVPFSDGKYVQYARD